MTVDRKSVLSRSRARVTDHTIAVLSSAPPEAIKFVVNFAPIVLVDNLQLAGFCFFMKKFRKFLKIFFFFNLPYVALHVTSYYALHSHRP